MISAAGRPIVAAALIAALAATAHGVANSQEAPGGAWDPKPGPAVRGHVLAKDTEVPLPGFRVELLRRGEPVEVTQTDPEGYFEFGRKDTLEGEMRLRVVPPSSVFEKTEQSVRLTVGEGAVEATLRPKCVFEVPYVTYLAWEGNVLQGEEGGPVEGVRVVLGREGRRIETRRTDEGGFFRFTLPGLPPGTYHLTVETGNGLLTGETIPLVLERAARTQREAIILTSLLGEPLRRATIFGDLWVKHGPAILGSRAVIRCVTAGHVLGTVTAGDGGHFRFGSLYAPKGPIVLEAETGPGPIARGETIWTPGGKESEGSLRRAVVVLRPTRTWWAGVLFAAVAGPVAFLFIVTRWVLPEWRSVRAGLRRAEG